MGGEHLDLEGRYTYAASGMPINQIPEEQTDGCIKGVKRMQQFLNNGTISEEDFQICVESNAERIGISVKDLQEIINNSKEDIDYQD